jgi:catechol 2,3-dioxygenase-like lactoylglutathione lyase family enzyme
MPRIRPAKFVHVVYRTRRFEEMIRWYETVFDAKVQHKNPGERSIWWGRRWSRVVI